VDDAQPVAEPRRRLLGESLDELMVGFDVVAVATCGTVDRDALAAPEQVVERGEAIGPLRCRLCMIGSGS
jgi:hypothetical protein